MNLNFEGKRDRWNGYDPNEFDNVIEKYTLIEQEKRKQRELEEKNKMKMLEEAAKQQTQQEENQQQTQQEENKQEENQQQLTSNNGFCL